MRTTLYTVLCIVVRLCAVLMALGVLGHLSALFVINPLGPDSDFFWISVGLEVAGLLMAFALWLWPAILVWWAIGRSQHQLLESSITAPQLQRVALSVVGVWVFITSLSVFLARGVVILMLKHEAASNDWDAMTVPASQWGGLVEYAVMATLGAATALGSGGLVGLLQPPRGDPHYAATETDSGLDNTQDS